MLGFGLFGRIRVRIGPEGDKALRMGQGGQMDGRAGGRTDSPCVLQDLVPFGAAALLPLNLNPILLKQGTGTADHLLPLGCYFDLVTCISVFSSKIKHYFGIYFV